MRVPVPKTRLASGAAKALNYFVLGQREEWDAYRRGITLGRRQAGLDVELQYDIEKEVAEWEDWYVPPSSVGPDDLIVDVGARDGDSLLFWALKGYRRFRLVEPGADSFARLERNAREMERFFGLRAELRNKLFDASDLEGAAFVKFDCEGCEREVDAPGLKVPTVAEMHPRPKRGKDGVYATAMSTGYARWGPW